MTSLTRTRRLAAAVATAFALALPAGAADPPAPDRGLPVGARAPEFALADRHGRTRALGEFLAEGRVLALLFYRSADW